MAKRKSLKKVIKEEEKEMDSMRMYYHWSFASMKIAVAAFVLFLLAVWPWLANGLLSVHWGIYLAIAIIFAIIPMLFCKKRK
jgi:hypothetical protein